MQAWLRDLLKNAGLRPACGSLRIGDRVLHLRGGHLKVDLGNGKTSEFAFDNHAINALLALIGNIDASRSDGSDVKILEQVLPVKSLPGNHKIPAPDGKNYVTQAGWITANGSVIKYTRGRPVKTPNMELDALEITQYKPDGSMASRGILPLEDLPFGTGAELMPSPAQPGPEPGVSSSNNLKALLGSLQDNP